MSADEHCNHDDCTIVRDFNGLIELYQKQKAELEENQRLITLMLASGAVSEDRLKQMLELAMTLKSSPVKGQSELIAELEKRDSR